MMRMGTDQLDGRDYLREEVRRAFAIHTRIMLGLMVAISGVAVTISELV